MERKRVRRRQQYATRWDFMADNLVCRYTVFSSVVWLGSVEALMKPFTEIGFSLARAMQQEFRRVDMV